MNEPPACQGRRRKRQGDPVEKNKSSILAVLVPWCFPKIDFTENQEANLTTARAAGWIE
jgi:hypothetical protein